MIYVVLGMHKSGTTLVSQTLHKSGVSMGREFDERVTYDQGNQWERHESFLINLDIVGSNEAQYYSLDNWRRVTSPPTAAIRERMLRLVETAEGAGGDWGFKDPLTCLTYPQWRSVLPPHRLICVYRSPAEVMRHYRVRDLAPLHARRVLRAWANYNAGVLDAIQHAEGPVALIRYEALMQDEREFARFDAFAGGGLVDMRRSDGHRAKRGHPLFGVVGRAMSLLGDVDPHAVLDRLDRIHAAQRSELTPHPG